MRVGYAHQSVGALAIAQGVKELLSNQVRTFKVAIVNRTTCRLIEVLEFGIGREGKKRAVRYCSRDGNPMGIGSSGVQHLDERPLDAVVIAALITEAAQRVASHLGGEVYRPLDDIQEKHPVIGAFEVL